MGRRRESRIQRNVRHRAIRLYEKPPDAHETFGPDCVCDAMGQDIPEALLKRAPRDVQRGSDIDHGYPFVGVQTNEFFRQTHDPSTALDVLG